MNRVDAPEKVTGQATYAAEHFVKDLCHGVIVSSTIARGKIHEIKTEFALKVPGVLEIFHHKNRPSLAWFDKKYKDEDAPPGSPYRPLYDDKVHFSHQPVALVVATTFEAARHAASLVEVTYEGGHFETSLQKNRSFAKRPTMKRMNTPKPTEKGDSKKFLQKSPFKVKTEYTTPSEHHNPLEMFASTVIYQDDGYLKIYDKTQGVANSQAYVCNVFNYPKAKVQVSAEYVGGAFGAALRPQHQLFMATLAALELKKSVRVSLTRQQMFSIGFRPSAIHEINLAADKSGKISAIEHKAIQETSRQENYTENLSHWGGSLYECENVTLDYKLAQVDLFTPLDMRAPGAATAVSVFESAIDELAFEAKIDPLEFRKINYSTKDHGQGKPFSSKELMACFDQGSERFGWKKRSQKPRSMKQGHEFIGYGMATGIWEVMQQKAEAKATLTKSGELIIESSITDIGTGTYTIMTKIASEYLGIPQDMIRIHLGSTNLPAAPLQGGSWTTASVGSAVENTVKELAKKLIELPGSPLAGNKVEELKFESGYASHKGKRYTLQELMQVSKDDLIVEGKVVPDKIKQSRYSSLVHSAVFVEVRVDEELGTVRVERMVSAIAGGKIVNPKTARSQILGGMVWGIGMALQEEGLIDHDAGRVMNHNLSEYHVPVNADIRHLDVIFVEEEDQIINQLGVKGLGEIGLVGVAGAISNAIFHATGKRLRHFPITVDKIIGATQG